MKRMLSVHVYTHSEALLTVGDIETITQREIDRSIDASQSKHVTGLNFENQRIIKPTKRQLVSVKLSSYKSTNYRSNAAPLQARCISHR